MRAVSALLLAAMLAGCGGPSGGDVPAAMDHSAHQAKGAAATSPAARALDASMAKMHAGMGQASDDPDESFMRMMIPHHRGAIEMARIELEHGKDPEARRLAETIIASQGREIRQIEAWLAKRQKR